MQWFKFYGQDWLTDTKIVRMTAVDKLLFITLLCLADQEGRVKDCDEDTLKRLTHLDDNPYEDINEWIQASGFMQRFSDNGMITLDTNGDVIIRNWVKRQSKNLTGYERVKRWREKQKQVNTPLNEGLVNDNNDNADTARIDKNRIEEKIYTEVPEEPKKEKKQTYSEGFAKCWGIYPRKDKMGPALMEWNKLKPGEELQHKIYKNISLRRGSEDWRKEDGKFVPYFITYLKDQRWLDEVKEATPIKSYGKPK